MKDYNLGSKYKAIQAKVEKKHSGASASNIGVAVTKFIGHIAEDPRDVSTEHEPTVKAKDISDIDLERACRNSSAMLQELAALDSSCSQIRLDTQEHRDSIKFIQKQQSQFSRATGVTQQGLTPYRHLYPRGSSNSTL